MVFNKKFPDFKSGVKYVTRYCGRVPISENRIVNLDTYCLLNLKLLDIMVFIEENILFILK